MSVNLSLKSGTTLADGKYTIEKELDSGGFGITYLANANLGILYGTPLVVKEFFLNGCLRSDRNSVTITNRVGADNFEDALRKFREETEKIFALRDHPGVVNVEDRFNDNETSYYVMEFVKGPPELLDGQDKLQGITFKSFLQSKPIQSNEGIIDCLYFIRQIADALAYCHSHHVYHLDVKPSNFLVSDQPYVISIDGLDSYEQYRLKLIDFGSAKVIENDEGVTSTLTGSQGYTAPEVDGGDFLSHASKDPSLLTGPDIYALGASLLYCFTERVPFGRRAIEEKLSKAKIQVPEEVQNIILKAMEYDPLERFRTAEEMQEALEEAIKALAEPKTVIIKSPRKPQTPKSSSTPSKKEWSQKKKSPVKWIVAVILIVAVAVVVWKIPQSQPPDPNIRPIDRGPITKLLSEGNLTQVEAEISMMMNNDLSSGDQIWLEDRQTYVRLMQEASDLSDQSRCDDAIAIYEEAREKCLPDHEDQIDDKIKLVNMTRGLNGCN